MRKQVRTLQKQVRTLQQTTTSSRKQLIWTLQMIEFASIHGDTCLVALTSDEFQNTWSQIDRLAISLGKPPFFGTQAAIDDKKACEELTVPRPPLDPSVAPTVTPYNPFVLWLHG